MPPHHPITTSDALSSATVRLSEAGIEPARQEAEWLLLDVLGTSRTEFYLQPRRILTPQQASRFSAAVDTRCARIPLQHILGTAEFYGRAFGVNHDVLIPRPETEALADAAVEWLRYHPAPLLLDVGTGSGAIAVTLACELPEARCLGSDISADALSVAVENARTNHVSKRVRFILADLLSAFRKSGAFHAVVSNPPYIRSSDIQDLQPEVRDHDPHVALDGGPDGLDYYRRLIPEVGALLRPGGLLLLEVGDGQPEDVVAMVQKAPDLTRVRLLPDLSGVTRIVTAVGAGSP